MGADPTPAQTKPAGHGTASILSAAEQWLSRHTEDLGHWRRDLHEHPELSYAEHRTTDLIVSTLTSVGLDPERLSLTFEDTKVETGVRCDIGPAADGRVVLRADIDALPLTDTKNVPYASKIPGVCHACGHDAHTAILLGVAAVLAEVDRQGLLTVGVRLIFQPAEERTPGGAQVLVANGAMDGVRAAFALHCDPRLEAGQVGLRPGPITAAFHQLEVRLTGPGGHTARPHLTSDVVYALGKVIVELPGLLSRRVDPRTSLSLVWGAVSSGSAANAIPNSGWVRGTLRMLDGQLWHDLEPIVRDLVNSIVEPTGANHEVLYSHGVPAVVNDVGLVSAQTQAALTALGQNGLATTQQSMGGEDFAWYLQAVPGAMARLGVHGPDVSSGDLHQSRFDIDERALAVGVRFTAALLDELAAAQG